MLGEPDVNLKGKKVTKLVSTVILCGVASIVRLTQLLLVWL